jgi:hypothetical protein
MGLEELATAATGLLPLELKDEANGSIEENTDDGCC